MCHVPQLFSLFLWYRLWSNIVQTLSFQACRLDESPAPMTAATNKKLLFRKHSFHIYMGNCQIKLQIGQFFVPALYRSNLSM